MKKTITKLLSVVVALGLMFSASACGGGEKKRTYTVEFNCMGGRSKISDVYVEGELFSPAPPSATAKLTGYTFTGWYYDEACTKPYDYLNPQIESNITLYAGWSNLHKINFYTDTGEAIPSMEVAYETTVNASDLPKPQSRVLGGKTYEFGYWRNVNTGERIDGSFTMSSMDINLYAIYNTGLSASFAVAGNGDWVAAQANALTWVDGESLSGYGSIEADMTIMSGVGWAGIAFQISDETKKYDMPFSQSGLKHYAFVILSGNSAGATQIVRRDEGSYISCSTGWGLTGTALKNTNYAKKYNAYKTSGEATFRMKVEILAGRVNGYVWDDINGEYELVCFATTDGRNASGTPNQTPVKYEERLGNTSVGLVSLSAGVRFSNFKVTPAATVQD